MLAKLVTRASPVLLKVMMMMMKKIQSTAVLLISSLALAACGQSGEANTQDGRSGAAAQSTGMPGMNGDAQSAEATGLTHSANGDITELSSDSVTISHGPVGSIGWPAMTMTFRAQSGDILQGLNVGDPVDFQFQKAGEQYRLTSIKTAQQ